MAVARLGVAPLLAVRNRARKHARSILLGAAQPCDAAPVNHMAAWQGPYARVACAIEQKRAFASRTDWRGIRKWSDSVLVSCEHTF